jgi:hypothetical protein
LIENYAPDWVGPWWENRGCWVQHIDFSLLRAVMGWPTNSIPRITWTESETA